MAKFSGMYKAITQSGDYDVTTALSLAVACELAYEVKDVVETTAASWGYGKCRFVERKKEPDIDTQAYVMADDQNLVVVFRGSDDVDDWKANFQAAQDPGPLEGTDAHEGFQDALFPTVMKVTEAIDEFRDREQKIWLTGHSLGGALCSLYAGMLIENGYEVYGLYTYASPRPGDDRFANQLASQIKGPHYRVVNTGDIVPHVPPEPFFSHSGNRIILDDEKRDISDDSWFEQRVNALRDFVNRTGKKFDVADNHRLNSADNSYIPRLIKDYDRFNTQVTSHKTEEGVSA